MKVGSFFGTYIAILSNMFIELYSLSSKRWLVNISDIVLVEERTVFSIDEERSIPILSTTKKCCTIIIRGRGETYWVKNSYKEIKELLIRYETLIKNSMG